MEIQKLSPNFMDIYRILTKSKLFKSQDNFENSKIEIGIRFKWVWFF
jgi:hypothetical protein